MMRERLNLHHPFVMGRTRQHLDYLRKHGSVHYLPQHQSWIVLGYDDVDLALKHPEIFSSTVHKDFDALLLGADPPSHMAARALLQPVFAPQRLGDLAEYVTELARDAMNSFKGKKELNFTEFATYTIEQKDKKLTEIAEQVEDHEMPLPSYTWVHTESKLNEQQINALVNWAKTSREKIGYKP